MEEQQQQFGGSPEHAQMPPVGRMNAGSPPTNENRGEFQDYPGEEEQPPLISGNLSDIARLVGE